MTAPPPELDQLIRRLGSTDPDAADDRMEAAHLLGLLGDRRATPALIAALPTARGIGLQSTICRALGRLGDLRALPVLIAQIPHATFWAVEAIANLRRKEAAPALIDALEDKHLRRIAAIGLGRLGSPGVVHGHVKWFNPTRGFGFVTGAHKGPPELFFHRYDWDGDGNPRQDQHVAYYALTDARKPCAVRVRPVEAKSPPAIDREQPARPATGVVRWFSRDRGFGFIVIDGSGDDALAHHDDIRGEGRKSLLAKQRVSCKVIQTSAGLRAIEIEPGAVG